MIYTLAVYGAPHSSQSPHTAYRFARTLLQQGHQIARVFFYHDGVHTGSRFSVPPQDEPDLIRAWKELAKQNKVELVVCVAAALKRGLLDRSEAARYGKPGSNLESEFEIVGLGQLIEGVVRSDRFVTFGC